ncbi:ATP-dependent helicase, partial [Listeria monocytogenes]
FVADFVTTLVESGEKVLLYGWHRKVYTEWKLLLSQFKPAFYTGTESTTVKEHELGRFLDPAGDCQVMIMSLRSGAGVDGLQFVCSTVVYGE